MGCDVRRVRVGCEFVYVAAIDTPTVLQVEPRNAAPVSLVQREWSGQPRVHVRRYADLYGNPCVRLVLPAGRCVLRYDALALVPDATEDADEQAPTCPTPFISRRRWGRETSPTHLSRSHRTGDPVQRFQAARTGAALRTALWRCGSLPCQGILEGLRRLAYG